MRKSLFNIFFTSSLVGSAWAQNVVNMPMEEIGPQTVFNNASSDLDSKMSVDCYKYKSRQGDPKYISCILSIMKQAGASPQAMAYTKLKEGDEYIISFREMGKVDLATAYIPVFAHDNEHMLLVNGSPGVGISVGGGIKHVISKAPSYQQLRKKYPELEIWASPTFETMRNLPNEGQRFIFNLPLINGCRGCEVVGTGQLSYDFNEQGKFLGVKVLGLKKHTDKILPR